MVTNAVSLHPDDATEGGLAGKNGEIKQARIKVHYWQNRDGTPVLFKSGPEQGQPSYSTVLHVKIAPDGEEELEQFYPIGSPKFITPGEPDPTDASVLKNCNEGRFLTGVDGKQTTMPKRSGAYLFLAALANAPGPNSLQYPKEKFTNNVAEMLEGLYCMWDRAPDTTREGSNNYITVPTIIHRFPWEAAVGTAATTVAPPPASVASPAAPPAAADTAQDYSQVAVALVTELCADGGQHTLQQLFPMAGQKHPNDQGLLNYLAQQPYPYIAMAGKTMDNTTFVIS